MNELPVPSLSIYFHTPSIHLTQGFQLIIEQTTQVVQSQVYQRQSCSRAKNIILYIKKKNPIHRGKHTNTSIYSPIHSTHTERVFDPNLSILPVAHHIWRDTWCELSNRSVCVVCVLISFVILWPRFIVIFSFTSIRLCVCLSRQSASGCHKTSAVHKRAHLANLQSKFPVPGIIEPSKTIDHLPCNEGFCHSYAWE